MRGSASESHRTSVSRGGEGGIFSFNNTKGQIPTIFSGMGIVVVSTWETDAANVEQIWERGSYARDYAYGEARHWATTSKSTAPQEAVEALEAKTKKQKQLQKEAQAHKKNVRFGKKK